MKLLLDENLSPHLAGRLADVYPGSKHVQECRLGSAEDKAIWQYAKDNGFTIVSKDSDFQERSVLDGFPPKLIWLRAANCTSAEIENLLRKAVLVITQFIRADKESCLVLGVRATRP